MSNNRRHVHSFSGTTRISDNHRHGFSGRTGVNLAPNSSGRHRHRYNVRTARVDEHRHRLINTCTVRSTTRGYGKPLIFC
jgi:hypothetical protein